MVRPNILWICADQQRFDTVHSLGRESIRTPNLDRLVERGVAFTRAYVQSPICTPSRASFLTGCRPSTTHVYRNGNEQVPPHLPLVTRELAQAGYDCGLIGKLHLSSADGRVERRPDDGYRVFEWNHHPARERFWPVEHDAYQAWLAARGVEVQEAGGFAAAACGEEGAWKGYVPGTALANHQTTWCIERSIAFVSERRSSPWLLSVNMFDPHPPFDPPEEMFRRMNVADMPLPAFQASDLETQYALRGVDFQGTGPLAPSEYEAKEMIAAYYAQIELIDLQLGRLLDALETTGQVENTIVLFMSDHGEMLGDHGLLYKGCRFYEGLVRVPLIVSWPGESISNVQNDSLVELIDVAPTLREAAGLEACPLAEGSSLLPLLRGDTSLSGRSIVRSEYHDALALPHGSHATMICDGRYKLVSYHGKGLYELYDLERDPLEFSNMWDDRAYAKVKDEMSLKALDTLGSVTDMGGSRVGGY